MRWTRQRRRAIGIAGRLAVSDRGARGRTALMRTAKSRGPDASTLASSFAEACRPNRARTRCQFARRRWQQSPITGEIAKEAVKTICVRECRVNPVNLWW